MGHHIETPLDAEPAEIEMLPSGLVVSDWRDVRYLRDFREQAAQLEAARIELTKAQWRANALRRQLVAARSAPTAIDAANAVAQANRRAPSPAPRSAPSPLAGKAQLSRLIGMLPDEFISGSAVYAKFVVDGVRVIRVGALKFVDIEHFWIRMDEVAARKCLRLIHHDDGIVTAVAAD
jgi:hypothetical protein